MPTLSWEEVNNERLERPGRSGPVKRKVLNGWFDATLNGVEPKDSKGGAPQLVFSFDVVDNDGELHQIRNWVTFSGSEIGSRIAMRDCLGMGLPPSEAPEVTFNEAKNCHDCDVDQIASVLRSVSEYTEGSGYRVRVKTENSEQYGTSHRIAAMQCPDESAIAYLTETEPSKKPAPAAEGRTKISSI